MILIQIVEFYTSSRASISQGTFPKSQSPSTTHSSATIQKKIDQPHTHPCTMYENLDQFLDPLWRTIANILLNKF